jgi:hypothetical protein
MRYIHLEIIIGIFLFGIDAPRGHSNEKKVNGNEIFIYGSKPESRPKVYGGYGRIIEPDQASRFDALSHFQKESSLTTLETGRISPTGASIPRIRGHDARLTEIYVDELPLQNPYSGLPIVDHLDLRAFGIMEVYQGMAPYDLPSSTPAGTIRYRWRKEPRNKTLLGLQFGKPYGSSGWGLFASAQNNENNSKEKQNPFATTPLTSICESNRSQNGLFNESEKNFGEFRFFFRQHKTNGEYLFYSDEGTPYNSNDDRIAKRINNDQNSLQLMPAWSFACGPWKFQSLAWWADTRAGIPTLSLRTPSFAREHSSHRVLSFGISRLWNLDAPPGSGTFLKSHLRTIDSISPWSLELDIKSLHSADDQTTQDPGAQFLVFAESTRLQVKSMNVFSSAHLKAPVFESHLSGQIGETSVTQEIGPRNLTQLKRQSTVLALGMQLKPLLNENLIVEGKKLWREENSKNVMKSQISQATETVDDRSTRPTSLESFALAWSPKIKKSEENKFNQLTIYIQGARSGRQPTLYEEFGNGSTITPNPTLKVEKITHREVGLRLNSGDDNNYFFVSYFKDHIDDKVIFVPIFANASKALNIRKAIVEGVEVRSQATFAPYPHFPTTFYAAYSRLWPMDKTRQTATILPSVPEKIIVLELTQKTPWFTGKWVSRYRSRIFRDVNNEVSLPGNWLHDLYADTSFDWPEKKSMKLGFMVRNIFDIIDVKVSSSPTSIYPTGQTGRTALSDMEGAPLPGRQWVFHLTLDLK